MTPDEIQEMLDKIAARLAVVNAVLDDVQRGCDVIDARIVTIGAVVDVYVGLVDQVTGVEGDE